ncbi:hypothetical protein Dvar_05380 [Desulfosarcina variabilis str. Montpellier]|uniref:hypothetical protein n=1 Tax=Desulfosarcina variabilis TaxID=2300 RepID=UPI003AFA9EBD
MKTNRSQAVAMGLVLLITCMSFLCLHCDRHETIVGKYQAVDTGQPDRPSATLELQAGGKGLWSIETDNAPFRWSLHEKTIRLHTQAGGIIQGVIDGERIRIDMPGTGVILFERQE